MFFCNRQLIEELGATIELEWIKLEFGEYATPFVSKSYAEELLACQRYFQIIDEYRINLGVLVPAGTNHGAMYHFVNTMRVAPTVTLKNDGLRVNPTGISVTPRILEVTKDGVMFVVTGLDQTKVYILQSRDTNIQNEYGVLFDAEIY